MYGASAYGNTYYGGEGAVSPIITAELVLEIRTSPQMPSTEPIPLGNDIAIMASFLDADEAVEPTTVVCEIRSPQGTISRPSVERVSLGVWQTIVAASLPGRWEYRVQAGGNVIAAGESVYWVANSSI
jgi:hypothetical protein